MIRNFLKVSRIFGDSGGRPFLCVPSDLKPAIPRSADDLSGPCQTLFHSAVDVRLAEALAGADEDCHLLDPQCHRRLESLQVWNEYGKAESTALEELPNGLVSENLAIVCELRNSLWRNDGGQFNCIEPSVQQFLYQFALEGAWKFCFDILQAIPRADFHNSHRIRIPGHLLEKTITVFVTSPLSSTLTVRVM